MTALATWELTGSGAMKRFGRALAARLREGDVLALVGDLGAGKTTLAQGIARGLGVPPEVPVVSPTFALMNHYQGRLAVRHLDLYRLSDPRELSELGFDGRLGPGEIALVEWADLFPELLPDGALLLRIGGAGEGARRVEARGGEGWAPRLAGLWRKGRR